MHAAKAWKFWLIKYFAKLSSFLHEQDRKHDALLPMTAKVPEHNWKTIIYRLAFYLFGFCTQLGLYKEGFCLFILINK